jgi:hypothetical protein
MSRCSPLSEAAIAAAGVVNMEETTVSTELGCTFRENPITSDGEKCVASPNAKDNLTESASDNVKFLMCYFGSSTITVGKINEMEEKGYFLEDEAHTPGAKTMPEPNGNEVVVYEDFLSPACACLRIQPWLIFYCTFRRSCIS